MGTTNLDSLELSGDLDITGGFSAAGDVDAFGRFGLGAATLASAAALAPTASCHSVTGTTAITSITLGSFAAGDILVLIFAGSITLTDGNNIVLAGGSNFAAAAGDVAVLICDGTNFLEVSRSDNTP